MNGDPRSHGLWEASAPPAPATSPLHGQVRADVAIIGGGFTGLSAALHAAEGGASVVVLEAVGVGFGASGRNVGLVNAGMWVTPAALREQLGETYGRRLLEMLDRAPSVVFDLVKRLDIECEAVHNGTLHCAVGEKGAADVKERFRQWKELGAPVQLCDRSETRELTGTDSYVASLLDHRAGTIQPLAYARGLASAAMRVGAKLHTDSRVADARQIDGQWQLTTACGATVLTKWVIVATDAYTATNGTWGGIRTEQVKLPYFNLATAPLSSEAAASILPQRQGAWDTRQVLSSFRFDAAGRLVFGSVGALRGMGHKIHKDWGQRALARLFPQLAGVTFEHEWYGSIGMTADALPRFHQLDRNVISFSGYNGRGIAPGTVLGRELAKLVLEQICPADLPLPVSSLKAARLRVVRECGYEAGAQLVHSVGARV